MWATPLFGIDNYKLTTLLCDTHIVTNTHPHSAVCPVAPTWILVILPSFKNLCIYSTYKISESRIVVILLCYPIRELPRAILQDVFAGSGAMRYCRLIIMPYTIIVKLPLIDPWSLGFYLSSISFLPSPTISSSPHPQTNSSIRMAWQIKRKTSIWRFICKHTKSQKRHKLNATCEIGTTESNEQHSIKRSYRNYYYKKERSM